MPLSRRRLSPGSLFSSPSSPPLRRASLGFGGDSAPSCLASARSSLVSLVVYVAKVLYFKDISAGWPCEIAAFLFLVIEAILFMRVPKPGSQAILFTSQLQPQPI